MGRHLVFVGAGHAHLTALANLVRYESVGGKVTVISAGEYHYYSGMGPGMLSGFYSPVDIRFNVKQLTESRGGTFIEEHLIAIDPDKRALTLSGGETVNYDVISFNTGSGIAAGPIDTSYPNVFTVKPIEHLYTAHCLIKKFLADGKDMIRIVVAGGGPAGIEMVCNVHDLVHANKNGDNKFITITLVAREKILSRFPAKVRKKALKRLLAKGIVVEENNPVKGNTAEKFLLEDNREFGYDFAFIATGTQPSPIFRQSGIPTGDDGGLLVNQYLQSVRYPEIFGGGDCICFQPQPLEKVGVFAVRQNPILMQNLEAALVGGKLTRFNPQAAYLLILNMGQKKALYHKGFFTFSGSMAFKIKNSIDRKFMEEFQLCGETKETLDCGTWETHNNQ